MADQILDLLNGMGNTPEEVADFLRGQGVRGQRLESRLCPLAMYLRQATGEHVGVCQYFFNVYDDGEITRTREILRIPKPIQGFITNFDHGSYPDLEG